MSQPLERLLKEANQAIKVIGVPNRECSIKPRFLTSFVFALSKPLPRADSGRF